MVDSRPTPDFVVPAPDAFGSSLDVGRVNAEAVLRALLNEGPMPRAAIADAIGLTRATVTRVTARLLDIGLLREEEPIRSNLGRPLVPLAIAGEDRAVATAHFGVHEVRVGLVGIGGDTLVERRFSYGTTEPAGVVALVARTLEKVVDEELGARTLLGVGASIGGWVNPESGRVVRFNALDWHDIPLAQMLADELGWPLHFDQMVRGIALAERMFGVARHVSDLVELWIGHIIGAAVVSDGSIRRGVSGASGLIGHMPVRGQEGVECVCGRRGCLGAVASDYSVLERARAAGVASPSTNMRDLVEAAKSGDAAIGAVIEDAAISAGKVATSLVDLLDPALVVVAGLITEAPQFIPAFRSALLAESEYRPLDDPLPVLGSRFGDAAPTIASASIVLDAFYRDPLGFGARSRERAVAMGG